MIRLTKGFCVSKDERQNIEAGEDSKYSITFNSTSHLYNDYLKNFILYEKKDMLECYNEYVSSSINPSICLFFDIDIEKKNFNHKKDPELLLNVLIANFIEYIYTNWPIINDTDDNNDDNDDSPLKSITDLDFNIFRDQMWESIGVSKNNNPNKISYHIYFKKLIFSTSDIKKIKNLVKEYQKVNTDVDFAQYIDTQVYKETLTLRFIYSKKNKNDEYYHEPLLVQGELVQDEPFEISTPQELEKFLIRVDPNHKGSFFTIMPETTIIKNIQPNIINIKPLSLSPIQDVLTLRGLFQTIFPTAREKIFIEYSQSIANLAFFESDKLIKEVGEEIIIKTDYDKSNCLFCGDEHHKNDHAVVFTKEGVVVYKKGNASNCKLKLAPYHPLTSFEICQYIFNKGLIKRTPERPIIFLKNHGWVVLTDALFKACLQEHKNDFSRLVEKRNIDKMTNSVIATAKDALVSNTDLVFANSPYLFKFKNGILNLKTNEFTPLSLSQHLYVLTKAEYDYYDPKNYSTEQRRLDKKLRQVIDQIIPNHKINGKTNKNRTVFECNVSSVILNDHKDVITVFHGATSAGKSTMKLLIRQTVGENNFNEVPISVYTNKLNQLNPNNSLGSITGKLASFASESDSGDRLNSQAVKLLTEREIVARQLFSTESTQKNCMTQFIDTNHKITRDIRDPAALRRIAVIHFKSFFKNEIIENLLDDHELPKADIQSCDTSLKSEIASGVYRLIFFNILKDWVKTYHFHKMSLINTADETDLAKFNLYFKQLAIPFYLVNPKDIKPEALDKYEDRTIEHFRGGSHGKQIKMEAFREFINRFQAVFEIEELHPRLKRDEKKNPFVLTQDLTKEGIETVIHYQQLQLDKARMEECIKRMVEYTEDDRH